jgi:peptidoglycan/xylan/chitin deacetylase (PgdA/CDA1 family)
MLKRLVNLVGSMSVAVFDGLRSFGRRLVGKRQPGRCVVLAYHSVSSSERSKFAQQMDVVIKHSTPIHSGAHQLPDPLGKYTAVTFDDGLQNIVDNALPELQKRNIPATLFIVTDVLGGNPGWEYFGGDDPTLQRAMNEEQLKRLPSNLVTIGSHTMTHPVLPRIEQNQLTNELVGSRRKLESMLNREVKELSFPYGSFDDRVVEACREAGYDRVFSALPVFAITKPDEFLTGRMGVSTRDWPIEFRLKLAGAYRWLPYAFSMKRKLLAMIGRRNTGLVNHTEDARAV